MTSEEWNTYFAGHWNFAGGSQSGHIAMFPEELPRRLIKMFSFKGETVLDPFAGSGTTSLAARNLDRNSVLFEINPEFIPVIKETLGIDQKDIQGTTYEFFGQPEPDIDFRLEIHKLPYVFKDPHTLNNKFDVKKLQFGSKIDKDGPSQKEELFTVKEIISPARIRLSNDLIVRLIGVEEIPDSNGKATGFMIEKMRGKRVFLKYDNIKYDCMNNLLCYLYLENKTFMNAHLIRSGLVQVDTSSEYKYKEKFLNLIHQNNG